MEIGEWRAGSGRGKLVLQVFDFRARLGYTECRQTKNPFEGLRHSG